MNSSNLNSGKLRLGFVGAGRVADVHYEAALSCADIAVPVAICDVRAEAVSERVAAWGVRGFASLEAMLDGAAIDAAVVLLPHDVHLPVMRTLLQRRIPVLLEKPLAASVHDADEIVRLTEEAGVPVLVGHNGLFHPAFERIVDLVRGGAIGRPLFGSARSLQWLFFKPWDFRLNRERTGGGAWIDCAGHLIYRLNALLGDVTSATGFTSHLARGEMEGEDTAAGVLRYQSGAIAQVAVSYGCKLPRFALDWPSGCEQMLMLSGDRGALEYHICPRSHIRLYQEPVQEGAARPDEWQELPIAEPFQASFDRQMRHFIDCVRGSASPRVPPSDAAKLLRTLLMLYGDAPDASCPPRAAMRDPVQP